MTAPEDIETVARCATCSQPYTLHGDRLQAWHLSYCPHRRPRPPRASRTLLAPLAVSRVDDDSFTDGAEAHR